MGIAEFEKVTFQIKFNHLYTKSDYTGKDFTAVWGNNAQINKSEDKVSIVYQNADYIGYLFMNCQEL